MTRVSFRVPSSRLRRQLAAPWSSSRLAYLLNRTLTITKPNIVLRGAGQGLSTIYIPSALSDVLGPKWQSDGRANKSSYAFMGGFISIAGPQPKSNFLGSFLTGMPLRPNVNQFARRLSVQSTACISVGQWVRIFINDVSTAGTCDHPRLLSPPPAAAVGARP
ncbi:hypothetical protein ABPG75_005235 [Micractinium tetrahymenae]